MNPDELDRYLQDRAGTTDLGRTPVQVIMRRGARRRARRRTMATAGVLAVGTVGAVATVQVLAKGTEPAHISSAPVSTDPSPDDTEAPAVTAIAPEPVGPADGVGFVDSPLVWNPVEVGSAESLGALYGYGIDRADGPPFLAVSTQPGRSANGQATVYRSDDGLRWAEVGPLARQSGQLDGGGGALYAVSTMASAADLSAARPYLVSSTDGETWNTQALPYDIAALRVPGVSNVSVTSPSVERIGDDLVVGAVIRASVTPASIAPVLGVDARRISYRPDGDGLVVYADAEAVPCDELERESNRVNADYPTATTVVVRPGDAAEQTGTTEPADSPTTTAVEYRQVGSRDDDGCYLWGDEAASYGWGDLGFPDDVVQAIVGTPVLFRTADGTTFEQLDVPAELAGVTDLRVGRIDDDYLLAGTSYVAPAPVAKIVRGTPERGWQALPSIGRASEQLLSVGAIDEVPFVAGWSTVWTLHGDEWTTVPLAQLAAPQTPTSWQLAAGGPRGIVLAAEVGDLVDPSVVDHPDQPWEFVEGSTHWVIYFSQDGVTWSKTELSDLIGDVGTQQIYGVQVTADQVLVSVREPASTDHDVALPGTTVLVGTLA